MGRYNNTNTSARRRARYTCAITLNYFPRHFLQGMSLGTLLPTSVCSARSRTALGGVVLNQMSNKVEIESPNVRSLKNKIGGKPCGLVHKDKFTHISNLSLQARGCARISRRRGGKAMFARKSAELACAHERGVKPTFLLLYCAKLI